MSRYKSKVGDEVPEVFSARSKLDGVLQTLVEQKEESASPEKEAFLNRTDTDGEFGDSSPLGTPTKRSPRIGKTHRKRKREEVATTSDVGQLQRTYSVKLFDRFVDLAQFNEDTPLYPVCRAWMHNNQSYPSSQSSSQAHTSSQEEGEMNSLNGFVYELPMPIKVKTERGRESRVPSPLPRTDKVLDIHEDPALALAPEELLLNHMVRWKQVRQKWKVASHVNEARYSESFNILRDMYEKQLREQAL